MPLYHDIARQLRDSINCGLYATDHRMPGVRRLSTEFSVSISTIVQALRLLEAEGCISARPRSGYYINGVATRRIPLPEMARAGSSPTEVSGQELVLQLAREANQSGYIQLGAAVPDEAFLPMSSLRRSLRHVSRNFDLQSVSYAFPPGLSALQKQIQRRMLVAGTRINYADILITNGCQAALTLALRSVAQTGDVIAVESPSFYGLLQVIESLGMKALEIPTSPERGLSVDALKSALGQWPVKAVVLTPNFNNPLGTLMPDNDKLALIELAAERSLTLIEDDIYGDLAFSGERPRSLYACAKGSDADVIYCSSFSKTISPGMRIGWILLPPQNQRRGEYLKYISDLAAPTLPQQVLAHYLAYGGYERHLNNVQSLYARQIGLFSQAVGEFFPAGTRLSQPKGGFVLWLELPADIDTQRLLKRLQPHRISIVPGQLFSVSGQFRHCIRLNCAQPWSDALSQSLAILGAETAKVLK